MSFHPRGGQGHGAGAGSGVSLLPAQDSFNVQRQGEAEEEDYTLDEESFDQTSEDGNHDSDSDFQQDSTDIDAREQGLDQNIQSELEHLSQIQVDPEVGMKVAKSRMLLQRSGILDEVTQMRRVLEKGNGVRIGMSLRKYNVSPSLHSSTVYGPYQHLGARIGGNSGESTVLPPRPAPRPSGGAMRRRPQSAATRRQALPESRPAESRSLPSHRPAQRQQPHKQPPPKLVQKKKPRQADSESMGIRALTRSLISRPISAPPQLREARTGGRRFGSVQTNLDTLMSSLYGEPEADSKVAFKDSIRPSPGATQSRSFKVSLPPPSSHDLSDWLFNGTIEDIFGKEQDFPDPRKQLHDTAVKRAGEKMVKEGKAQSVPDALRKMKEHWYSRTGEWKHYAWSAFGAEHKTWAATPWFSKGSKDIEKLVGAYAEPPMDPELANMVKTCNPTVKDRLYVLGVASVEALLESSLQELKEIGFSKGEVQLLFDKANKIVAQGPRAQRVQRRMVSAMLARSDASPSKGASASDRPRQLAQQLQGMFLAAAGGRDTINAEDLLASVQAAGVVMTDADAAQLTAMLAASAEARGERWRGELSLQECFDLFWLVPLNDGQVRLDMPPLPSPLEPTSPGSTTTSFDGGSPVRSPPNNRVYKPVNAQEWHSIVPDDLPWNSFSAFATGSTLPREGGPTGEGALQDDDRLCVFIESCTAIRGHSKSLRGSQNRYDDLAHELMHTIERIRVDPTPCAVINPGISQLLVTAVRRGGERWARQHAEHLRSTEWMNSRYPRYGSMEVWAFLPHEPTPVCLFSKLDEKRFPQTDGVISRIIDCLNVKFKDHAPAGVSYLPPTAQPQRCDNCRKGKIVNNRCSWCAASMAKEFAKSSSPSQSLSLSGSRQRRSGMS